MTNEAMLLFLRLNLIGSAAILLVLALRPFVRRWLGASQCYHLWLTVPLALVAAIMPPLEAVGPAGPIEAADKAANAWLGSGPHQGLVLAAWIAGVLVCTGLVALRYAWFMGLARSGRAGPAIVGVLTPKLITPDDFFERFTAEERRLVRAHERAHMDRDDARCNALVLALQCLNWFNPLIHVAAKAMRFDQELACDATVVMRLPNERRRYAETLLRSHGNFVETPLGCNWSGKGARLLMTRLTSVMSRSPDVERCDRGDAMLACLWTAVFILAWTAQPRQPQGRQA